MNRVSKLVIICTFVTTFANSICYGWLRARVEDAVLVERSELIVIAHLKADSIKYVPHKREKNEGMSWEHHAVLAVTEVLKGKVDKKEVPIVIHYGLDPVVGGYLKEGGIMVNLRGGRKDYPQDIIEIMDTGNSAPSRSPIVKDAGEDNIWFMRRRSGRYGREDDEGKFGIVDPEELQPISMKGYFLACLSEDPEEAVKEERKRNPDLAARVRQYLIYKEFQRDLAIADPNEKAERLLRYLFRAPKGYDGRHNHLVRKHVAELGEKAMDPILEILGQAKPTHKLDQLLYILYEIGKPRKLAVPYLRKMLEQGGRTSTYYILGVLGVAGDPNAIDSVRPFLADENMQVRAQAAETLAWLGDVDSFERIVAAMPEEIGDQNAHYIKDMCGALYRLDPARARPIIKRVNARVPSMDITRFISRYRDNDD